MGRFTRNTPINVNGARNNRENRLGNRHQSMDKMFTVIFSKDWSAINSEEVRNYSLHFYFFKTSKLLDFFFNIDK